MHEAFERQAAEITHLEIPGQPCAHDQEQEPQRASQISHDPHEKVDADRQRKLSRKDQPKVLEISLAPSPVPLEVIHQSRRSLLVGTLDVPRQPHLPALGNHQRGLHEIMAEYSSSKRLPAGQRGQLAELRERLHTDHRIMPPIAAPAELPEIQPPDEKRAVEPHRELLQPRENGNAADQLRRCLQDAELGIHLHHLRHFHDVRTVHQAVRVQNQHAFVTSAPCPDEIADIPSLAVLVLLTAPVVDPPEALEAAAKVRPRHLLQHPEVEIPGIAEDEEIERGEMPGRIDGAVDRLDPGAEFRAVLVVNRHHHRIALPEHIRRPFREFHDAHIPPAAPQHGERTEQRVKRAEHEQAVEDCEDQQQRDVGAVQA